MSPVDAVRPPQRKKKPSPAARPIPVQIKKEPVTVPPTKFESKKQLLWILVIATAVIIFAGWLLLSKGGPLSISRGNSPFSSFGQTITNLWEKFKTDILKIKTTTDNANLNSEERIKQLEGDVFPQFTDPSKQ